MKHWLVTLCAALAACAAVACGSGDKKIDEERAELIAERALLAETHLPGRGWVETDRDNFEESDDFPDTRACRELNEFFESLEEDDDEGLVRTNVTYERDTGDPITIEVEHEIEVHEGTSRSIDIQEAAEELLESANFDDCMEDFARQAGEDIGGEAEYRRRRPTADAPDNGFAMAFMIRLAVQGEEAEVVGEMYMWNDGHVQSQLTFLGTEDQLDEDLLEDIIEESVERVRAAQEAD